MTAVSYAATKGLKLLGNETGAWLAGITGGDVNGAELVTNPWFTSDTSGWTAVDAVLTAPSSRLRVVSDGGPNPSARQDITVVPGETYIIRVTLSTGTAPAASLFVYETTGWTILGSATDSSGALATLFFSFTASSTKVSVQAKAVNAAQGEDAYFNFINLRRAAPDRSNADAAIGIHGTLTRDPVAPGAELVAYSGFGIAAYLSQPYNPTMNVGTGDFSASLWVKTGAQLFQNLLSRSSPTSGVNGPFGGAHFSITKAGAGIRFTVGADFINVPEVSETEFVMLTMARVSGVLYAYINGVLSAAVLSPATVTNSTGVVRVGNIPDDTWTWAAGTAEVALVRLGLGLSAAQVASIYESEKDLFKSNRIYTQAGVAYSLDFDSVPVLTRTPATHGTARLSIDGTREYLAQRDEVLWDVTTGIVDRSEYDPTRRFLESTARGAQFTFDPYGSVAEADDPRQVTLESGTHAEQTTGSRLLNTSFKVREL